MNLAGKIFPGGSGGSGGVGGGEDVISSCIELTLIAVIRNMIISLIICLCRISHEDRDGDDLWGDHIQRSS